MIRGTVSLPGEFASSLLLCANFFLRACAMIEAGSFPSVGAGGFLRGVPPGDLQKGTRQFILSKMDTTYCSHASVIIFKERKCSAIQLFVNHSPLDCSEFDFS